MLLPKGIPSTTPHVDTHVGVMHANVPLDGGYGCSPEYLLTGGHDDRMIRWMMLARVPSAQPSPIGSTSSYI